MALLWLRMCEAFGQSAWESKQGAAGGAVFLDWSQTLQQYTQEQIARGVKNCEQWQSPSLPTKADFCRLCLTDLRPPATQPAAPDRDQTIRDRESARQRLIKSSPKSRHPSASDVETFMQAYNNCGCGRRWPGGKVAL